MNEFIISTKGSLWECSCPKCKGNRQGSRKGSATCDTMSNQEITQYIKDHSVQEVLDTKFPNIEADELWNDLIDGLSPSVWENTVAPLIARESDAENKVKQACRTAGIDSNMSIDDWYEFLDKHNFNWGGSPAGLFDTYMYKGLEKVFGCKPYTGYTTTTLSDEFINKYNKIHTPDMTEDEKRREFDKHINQFNNNVNKDKMWKTIKDSNLKKGEERKILEIMENITSDPYYGKEYFL